MKGLSRLSEDGSIEIPAHLRECLGLEPGDTLLLRVEDDGRLVVEKDARSSITALKGSLGYLGRSFAEARQAAWDARAEEFKRDNS